jgi:proline dehydrogenase
VSRKPGAFKGLVRSRLAGNLAQASPLGRRLAKRLIGGTEVESAMERASGLIAEGFLVALHYLPRTESEPADQVGEHFGELTEAMNGLSALGLDVFVSASANQMGYSGSDENGERNAARLGQHLVERATFAERIADKAQTRRHCLMIEMEDYASVEQTLLLRSRLARHGVPAAITLQANLHRSADDLKAQIAERASVRLVKGAYPQKEEQGMNNAGEIAGNFVYLAGILFSEDAFVEGIYPIIATHDATLIEEAEPLISRAGWPPDGYEFQFYLGLETSLQKKLKEAGHRVRVQIPFGPGWWSHASQILTRHPTSVYRT